MNNNYGKSMSYETLVRRAFNCERGTRNGADISYMLNLFDAEKGNTSTRTLGDFEKQFDNVKSNISKALIKLSKTKPFSSNKTEYLRLDESLSNCATAQDLLEIVNESLALDNNTNKELN